MLSCNVAGFCGASVTESLDEFVTGGEGGIVRSLAMADRLVARQEISARDKRGCTKTLDLCLAIRKCDMGPVGITGRWAQLNN